MRYLTLLWILTASAWGQEAGAPPPLQEGTAPASLAVPQPAPQVSLADRLALSQAEAALWKTRYAAELQERQLRDMIAAVQGKCEQAGGEFVLSPQQSPSMAECGQKEKPSEAPKP